mgnify:CR=1 FL=1
MLTWEPIDLTDLNDLDESELADKWVGAGCGIVCVGLGCGFGSVGVGCGGGCAGGGCGGVC